jgi:hypothetical protein
MSAYSEKYSVNSFVAFAYLPSMGEMLVSDVVFIGAKIS